MVKLQHKVPHNLTPKPPEISERYQAEVDHATHHAETLWQQAQHRLELAEQKAARLEAQRVSKATRNAHKQALASALVQVELRRAELEELERMMKSSPSSLTHRGRGGYKPVPVGRGSLL